MTRLAFEVGTELVELPIVRFHLFGYLDEEAASEFIQSMWEQDCEEPQSVWDVVLNTEGGDMEAGTAIFSELRAHSERGGGSHYVITHVRGQAASCGSLILQAGDYRTAGKMDYIMMHEPLITFQDATLQRVRDELAQADSWTSNFLDVICERGTTGRDFFAQKIAGRDWWLSSCEALELGLIDEVT